MKSWMLLMIAVVVLLVGIIGCEPCEAADCCHTSVAVQTSEGLAVEVPVSAEVIPTPEAVQVPTYAAATTRPATVRVITIPVTVSTCAPKVVVAPVTCAPAAVIIRHGPIFDRTLPFFHRGPVRRIVSAPVRFAHTRQPIRSFFHTRQPVRKLLGCGR